MVLIVCCALCYQLLSGFIGTRIYIHAHIFMYIYSTNFLFSISFRNIQSWKLSDIKRDDYAPNTPGLRQWEWDRKRWLANKLVEVVKVREHW